MKKLLDYIHNDLIMDQDIGSIFPNWWRIVKLSTIG